MKSLILASLFVATSVMANTITFDAKTNTATVKSAKKGTAAELYEVVAAADKNGLKDEHGKDVYVKAGASMGKSQIGSKLITAGKMSGISTSYTIKLVGAKNDSIKLEGNTLTLKGKAADQLFESMKINYSYPDVLIVGSFTINLNNRIICSQPVVAKPVSTCTIKVK